MEVAEVDSPIQEGKFEKLTFEIKPFVVE